MILIGGKAYELITDHKNGWNQEVFRERYSEVLDRYDYIVGDWGYSQMRLRGFFKENSPRATKESTIAVLQDYLNEYCNFGCAYFIIERVPGINQIEGEGDHFADEASLREETTAAQEDMPKYTIRSQPAPERAPRPQNNPASQGDRQNGSGQGQQGTQSGGRPPHNRGGASHGQQGQQGQRTQGHQQGGKPQGQLNQFGGRPQGAQREQDHIPQQGARPNNPSVTGHTQSQRAQVSSQDQGQGQQQGGGSQNQHGNRQHQGQRSNGPRQNGHKQHHAQQNKQPTAPNPTGRNL